MIARLLFCFLLNLVCQRRISNYFLKDIVDKVAFSRLANVRFCPVQISADHGLQRLIH